MNRHSLSIRLALLVLMVGTISAASHAQSIASRFGAEAKISTLGIGGEGAVRLTHRINVRAGYNAFNFDHTFSKDGITYGATLGLRSFTANADLYLLGPLHISPGALLYNGFKVSANAAVASGNTFTLGGTTYESGSANPLHGALAMTVPKAAPELLIGVGNLVPAQRPPHHVQFRYWHRVPRYAHFDARVDRPGLRSAKHQRRNVRGSQHEPHRASQRRRAADQTQRRSENFQVLPDRFLWHRRALLEHIAETQGARRIPFTEIGGPLRLSPACVPHLAREPLTKRLTSPARGHIHIKRASLSMISNRCRIHLWAAIHVLLLLPLCLRAQGLSGEIQLAVKDSSGGAMRASGRLENLQSGAVRSFETDSNGTSTLGNLTYGRYRLEISGQGFVTQSVLVDVETRSPVVRAVTMVLGVQHVSVDVIAATPLAGSDLPLQEIPASVQTATQQDLAASGSLDLSDFLNRRLSGVNINENQENPFQPDLNYRGYTASPLLGTPEGISVFMDGVRQNQPFGDVVSWDLIPRVAISEVALVPGSNPLFGLNALGGAVSIPTKDGRSNPGSAVEIYGGSFGRQAVEFEHGGSNSKRFELVRRRQSAS